MTKYNLFKALSKIDNDGSDDDEFNIFHVILDFYVNMFIKIKAFESFYSLIYYSSGFVIVRFCKYEMIVIWFIENFAFIIY